MGSDDKPEPERGNWGGKLDFFMSCVGYAVGLGNVWRFPYLCYRNGGGAFLVPYVLMLFLAGLPMFFFELALGQFASLGPISVWKISPLFRGVGFAAVSLSIMVSVYYNVIIAYALFYVMVSMISLDGDLPWMSCSNTWNTPACARESKNDMSNMTEIEKLNFTLGHMDPACINRTLYGMNMEYEDLSYNFTMTNLTSCNDTKSWRLVTPSEEYFTRFVLGLHEAEDFGNVGGVSLKMAFALALSWIILFFCLKKGVKTSGKVVYFMASFPYMVLICLLVRGITLDGYMEGIKFYIIPKWEKLRDIGVWKDASTQIFYSLGPGFGSLITMASYNPFKHNSHRDAILVSIINCSTSVFAGFVIFSMLGYLANLTHQAVEDVAVDGPGLVFIVYPEGIARMPVAPLWAFLFFFMLTSLGLDSQFAVMEAIISSIIDEFPSVLRRNRTLFTLFCHLVGFVLGLAVVTKGGIWVLTLMDSYSASYGLLFVCFCELAAVSWAYGIKRFSQDIKMMMGFEPNIYWKGMWLVITPLVIVLMIIISLVKVKNVKYGDYEFEDWVQGIGWAMVILPVVLTVTGFIVQRIRYGSFKKAMEPSPDWGPTLDKHRTGHYAMDNLGFEEDGDSPGTHEKDNDLRNGHLSEISTEYKENDNGVNEGRTKF